MSTDSESGHKNPLQSFRQKRTERDFGKMRVVRRRFQHEHRMHDKAVSIEIAPGDRHSVGITAVPIKILRLESQVSDDPAAFARIRDLDKVKIGFKFGTPHDKSAGQVQHIMLADELIIRIGRMPAGSHRRKPCALNRRLLRRHVPRFGSGSRRHIRIAGRIDHGSGFYESDTTGTCANHSADNIVFHCGGNGEGTELNFRAGIVGFTQQPLFLPFDLRLAGIRSKTRIPAHCRDPAVKFMSEADGIAVPVSADSPRGADAAELPQGFKAECLCSGTGGGNHGGSSACPAADNNDLRMLRHRNPVQVIRDRPAITETEI